MPDTLPNVHSGECHPPFCLQQEMRSQPAGGPCLAQRLAQSVVPLQAKVKRREESQRARSESSLSLALLLPMSSSALPVPCSGASSLPMGLLGVGVDLLQVDTKCILPRCFLISFLFFF